MHSLICRIALLLVLCAVGACDGDEREVTPEAQQLARINRELAALRETVEALHARVDRLENERAVASPAEPIEPAKDTGEGGNDEAALRDAARAAP